MPINSSNNATASYVQVPYHFPGSGVEFDGIMTVSGAAFWANNSNSLMTSQFPPEWTLQWTAAPAASTADITASMATTAVLAINGNALSRIDTNGDQDWFRLELQAGVSYNLQQTAVNGSRLDSLLSLMDSSGVRVAQNDDSNHSLDSQILFTPTTSAVYYLSAAGYGNSIGTYLVSATVVPTAAPTADIAASIATTAVLAINSSAVSRIDTNGDQDWFRLELQAGVQYNLQQTAVNGSRLDSLLSLMDSSGSSVARNDDSNGSHDSQILFTPTTSAVYYLSAAGYGSSIGVYQLSATAVPSADIAASIATTAVLAINSSAVSRIDTNGDQDWFRLELQAGVQYNLQQTAVNGSRLDSLLSLMDSSGSSVARNDDSNGSLDSQILVTPTTSAVYYLSAAGYGTSIGAYQLSVHTVI